MTFSFFSTVVIFDTKLNDFKDYTNWALYGMLEMEIGDNGVVNIDSLSFITFSEIEERRLIGSAKVFLGFRVEKIDEESNGKLKYGEYITLACVLF